LFITNCNSQEKDMQRKIINREAVAAGRFYQSDAIKLKSVLKDLFGKALPIKNKNTLAIISPHAGYAYSGEVAASAFNQVNWDRDYDNIFIIASSHNVSFFNRKLSLFSPFFVIVMGSTAKQLSYCIFTIYPKQGEKND